MSYNVVLTLYHVLLYYIDVCCTTLYNRMTYLMKFQRFLFCNPLHCIVLCYIIMCFGMLCYEVWLHDMSVVITLYNTLYKNIPDSLLKCCNVLPLCLASCRVILHSTLLCWLVFFDAIP